MSMAKTVALTFDDGPNTITTPKVLDLLEQYGIKASFFLIGQNVTPESVKVTERALKMGCEICNHTYTHPFMSKLTKEQIIEEVEKTDAIIEKLTGKRTLFFRPPYIDVTEQMYECIDKIFICGVGCMDWEPKTDAAFRREEMLRTAEDGVLYLLHDMTGNEATVDALKVVIPTLLDRGYEFATTTEIFTAKQPLFDPVKGYATRPRVLFSNIKNDYQG